MNAVEGIDDQNALIALRCDITNPGIAAVPKRTSPQENNSTLENDDSSARGKRLRPLLALTPYLARYRTKTIAALVALIVASLATLVVWARCGP